MHGVIRGSDMKRRGGNVGQEMLTHGTATVSAGRPDSRTWSDLPAQFAGSYPDSLGDDSARPHDRTRGTRRYPPTLDGGPFSPLRRAGEPPRGAPRSWSRSTMRGAGATTGRGAM